MEDCIIHKLGDWISDLNVINHNYKGRHTQFCTLEDTPFIWSQDDVSNPILTRCCLLCRKADIQFVRIGGTSIFMSLLIIMWWLRWSNALAKSMRTIFTTVCKLSVAVYHSCRSCIRAANMKALPVLSHSCSSCLQRICLYKKMIFCGSVCALLENFHEKKLPPDCLSHLG